MKRKDAGTIRAELAAPFAPEDLEWRLQRADKDGRWGIAVPFVTNRAIQNRLDDVVGPENWYNDFRPWHGDGKKEAQICGISIYFEEHQGFITKWDGAEDSDIEPVKGGLSDSMKRAAVQWGVGRVLYNMSAVFVDVEKKGASWVIKDGQQPKLDCAYLGMLAKLGQVPAGGGQPQPEDAASGGASGNAAPAAQPVQTPPAYEYIVRTREMQKGMSAKSTQVVLESADKKLLTAFARGEHPALAPGVMIDQVKLAKRQQDTVVFHVLEAYQVVGQQQRAA